MLIWMGPIYCSCPPPDQRSDTDCSEPVMLKGRSPDQQLKLLGTRKSVRSAHSRSSLHSPELEMLRVGASSLNSNKYPTYSKVSGPQHEMKQSPPGKWGRGTTWAKSWLG